MAAMAQAHRTTSGHTHTASSSASTSTATAATMTAATSPPSPAGGPPHPGPVGPWGTTSNSTYFSDIKAVLTVLCFSCVAICLLYAARFLLSCLDRHLHRRRAAREPKPGSDADDDGNSAGACSPVVAAGVWAEAECAICLAELIDDDDLEGGAERVRVRVLPACGHGFHAACVEAWLATRASCPTCRAPLSSRSRSSRPSSRTTRQP